MKTAVKQATCIECEHWLMGLCFKNEKQLKDMEPDAKSCEDFKGDKPL